MTEFRRTIQNSLLDNGYFVFERFADRDQVRNIRSIVVDFFESNNALIHDYKYDPPAPKRVTTEERIRLDYSIRDWETLEIWSNRKY